MATQESFVKPPVLMDRYVVTGSMGKGGTSEVFLAFDQLGESWRACKVLAPHATGDAVLVARFTTEAECWGRVSSDHVVRMVDAYLESEPPFLVLELARGGSLMGWVEANGPLPPQLAVAVGVQICRGLRAVHRSGWVHNDVQPKNVLLDADGRCKLVDFGHAARFGDALADGMASPFSAPEASAGEPLDARADVYSVAATLSALLTAKMSTVPTPAESNSGSPALGRVLEQATRHNRNGRYISIEELEEALLHAIPDVVIENTVDLVELDAELPKLPPAMLPQDEDLEQLGDRRAKSRGNSAQSEAVEPDADKRETGYAGEQASGQKRQEVMIGVEGSVAVEATPEEAPEPTSRGDGLLVKASLVIVAVTVLLSFVAVTLIVRGAQRVGDAGVAAVRAQTAFVSTLESGAKDIMPGLPARDRRAAERAFFDYHDATPDTKLQHAIILSITLEREIGQLDRIPMDMAEHKHALSAARTSYEEAQAGWVQAGKTPLGRLAITLGAPGP